MRSRKPTYKEMMQALVEEYRESGEPWPATRKTMARWMIRNGKWKGGDDALVNICARDISRALREEYYTDPQGRRVRTKHAARLPLPGTEDGQQTFWGDIRTEPREFIVRAFKGRRNQIVGDCVQLNADVKSANENRFAVDPIPMLFDFTDDVLESEQSAEMKDQEISPQPPVFITPPEPFVDAVGPSYVPLRH